MRKLLACLSAAVLLALVLPSERAEAACASTISVKDGAGATITTCDTTDGGTGLIPSIGLLGGTNNANKAIVDGNGGLDINLLDLNGNTVLVGNGVTGTGSQRVTIASDNTAFTVNAAESGTWNITNISGTITLPTGAATAAKQPALGTAGSASTDVISIQGIASMTHLLVTPDANSSVNIGQVGGASASTAASGVLKVGIVGNAGGIFDAAGQNAVSPANEILVGGQFNTTPTTITSGRISPLQMDSAGRLIINCTSGCSGSGGTSIADEAAFTQGSTSLSPIGGIFSSSITNLTTGQAGVVQLTNDRQMFVNLGKIAGTTADTNSGVKSAGTLRVVLATDQPQLTNKLLVTPDSVALPANQSVNVSQINAVTPLMGNGVTGTGSQRVTIASDNSAVSGLGVGATGSAPPANAQYNGASSSGLLAGMVVCDNHTFKHITTATDTLVVQGVTSKIVKVCGFTLQFAGTATAYLENTASTNANCSSTLTQLNGNFSGLAQSTGGFYNPIWGGLANTSGNGLCVNSTGTGGVDVDVWYTQGS